VLLGCDKGDAPAAAPPAGPAKAPVETGLEGAAAPAFAADAQWVQGPPIAPEAAAGKVVVLEFGFASCRWCAAAQPKLATLAKQHAEQGLVVAWINDGRHAERAEVDEIVKSRRLTFPVVHDATGETAKAYRVPGKYPWAVVIDRKGHVAYQGDALRPENEKQLETAILAALR
jgi:peroxiredoxin